MFHPQPLVAFLTALALVLTGRMIRDSRYGLVMALMLGTVVGAAQLVRSVGVWALGVVAIALLCAAVVQREERRTAVRALVVVCLLGVLLPLPWYVHLQQSYSDPIFGRGSLPAPFVSTGLVPGRSAAPPPFRLAAAVPVTWRDTRFYLDPGLPGVVTAPHRRGLPPAFWPILYDDFVGRLFRELDLGLHADAAVRLGRGPAHGAVVGRSAPDVPRGGRAARGGPPRCRAAALTARAPACAAAGGDRACGDDLLRHSHPATDGDTVKGLFILPAVPALAVCFGFAVETLARHSRVLAIALVLLLVACLGVSLAFGIA